MQTVPVSWVLVSWVLVGLAPSHAMGLLALLGLLGLLGLAIRSVPPVELPKRTACCFHRLRRLAKSGSKAVLCSRTT